MIVRVHQAGRHVVLRKVDYIGARWNGNVPSNCRELPGIYEDYLVGRHAACFRIHQMADPKRRHLCGQE
jgi:hypothetical protein